MKKNILVIEDEAILGESIRRFLKQHNYKVTLISEGINGVEDIRKENPDLILTDLLLPRLHGFDICRSVKEDSQLKEIPLIVMTAVYKGSIHKSETKNLGVEDFIEKPLDLDVLLKKIVKLIGPTTPVGVKAPPEEGKKKEVETREDGVVQKQFQDLKGDYVQQLPGKIMELERIWERIQRRQNTMEHLLELRRLVHSLTGSGTSFGVKEISENARRMELLLDMIVAEGEETIGNRKDKIDVLLDMLRHHPLVSTEMEIMRNRD